MFWLVVVGLLCDIKVFITGIYCGFFLGGRSVLLSRYLLCHFVVVISCITWYIL